jgi:MerR family mercuric resistance operon transcriptional regulator
MKKRISDVARAAGVGVETVRFYQRAGVLDEPVKPLRGWRSYGSAILRQLEYIRLARRMGLRVSDIAAIKKSLAGGRSSFCRDVRTTVEKRIASIDAQVAALTRSRAELAGWLATCQSRPAGSDCPLYRELSAVAGARK